MADIMSCNTVSISHYTPPGLRARPAGERSAVATECQTNCCGAPLMELARNLHSQILGKAVLREMSSWEAPARRPPEAVSGGSHREDGVSLRVQGVPLEKASRWLRKGRKK